MDSFEFPILNIGSYLEGKSKEETYSEEIETNYNILHQKLNVNIIGTLTEKGYEGLNCFKPLGINSFEYVLKDGKKINLGGLFFDLFHFEDNLNKPNSTFNIYKKDKDKKEYILINRIFAKTLLPIYKKLCFVKKNYPGHFEVIQKIWNIYNQTEEGCFGSLVTEINRYIINHVPGQTEIFNELLNRSYANCYTEINELKPQNKDPIEINENIYTAKSLKDHPININYVVNYFEKNIKFKPTNDMNEYITSLMKILNPSLSNEEILKDNNEYKYLNFLCKNGFLEGVGKEECGYYSEYKLTKEGAKIFVYGNFLEKNIDVRSQNKVKMKQFIEKMQQSTNQQKEKRIGRLYKDYIICPPYNQKKILPDDLTDKDIKDYRSKILNEKPLSQLREKYKN